MKAHQNVTPRQEALAERNLCVAVAALRTPEDCRDFFRDLCTPAELQAMADRWAVVEFLKEHLPYREIHRRTGVSVTTIGRVARFLAEWQRRLCARPPAVRRNPAADAAARRETHGRG